MVSTAPHRLAIEPANPTITNPQAAIQTLAFGMTNAIALFEVLEQTLFEQVVPDNSTAGQVHAAMMIGIETLRQHVRVAHCIHEAMEITA